MSGLMGPKEGYDLVSAIKDAEPDMPLVIHTHCTTGLAFMTYLKCAEAGADVLVAGSAVYGAESPAQAIDQIRDKAAAAYRD